MLIHLIEFGGIVFWAIIGFATLAAFFTCESDEADIACPILMLASIFIVYGLSNAPMLNWKFFAGHFGTGIIWSLFIFHVKLVKVRNWIRANPESLVDGKFAANKSPQQIRYIYENEPSFPKFASRITCWPISILKFLFGDMLQWAYEQIKYTLLNYKNIMLGLK